MRQKTKSLNIESYKLKISEMIMIKLFPLLLLICISVSCAGHIDRKTDDTNQGITLVEIVKKLDTPKKISAYMTRHLSYTSDQKRSIAARNGYWWKTPEETFQDKYGFCYDLAAFALYCLVENNYPDTRILFVCWGNWGRESQSGHLVCTYRQDNKYYTIDNGRLKGPFHTLDQLLASAGHNHTVKSYRFFQYSEIPFHISYHEMAYFSKTP